MDGLITKDERSCFVLAKKICGISPCKRLEHLCNKYSLPDMDRPYNNPRKLRETVDAFAMEAVAGA
jgi:hypothetical protein